MLRNKKILLAVCGSIAFYKAYEILSALKKEGADVRVMLSDGALKFCSEAGFEALCEHKILTSRTESWQDGLNHIAYAKTDLILIAPTSVNTINKYASGICDNVFLQTLIASDAPVLIAPAANNKMLENPATRENIEILRKRGVNFIDPVEKILACGDVGKGALADVSTIVCETKRMLTEPKFKGQKVVVAGGATSEKIDDVRAVTNLSSGKTAKALADAFYYAGADVTLIASFETANAPYKTLKFQSSAQLKELLRANLTDANLLAMAAAVSDYAPKTKFEGKLKKQNLGEIWMLELAQNDDILGSLTDFKNVKKIGFKMETDAANAMQNAKNMLEKKSLDAVCLNVLGGEVNFGSDSTQITFITHRGAQNIALTSKEDAARQIVNLATKL